MERLALAGRIEVKLAEPGVETAEKSFSGYGAVFGNQDHASDIIAPGAFAKTLAEHKAAGTSPSMFFNHNAYEMPIGVWDALLEDEVGLKATGRFLDTVAGRDAYTATKAGAVSGLSIGYFATEYSIDAAGVRTITEVKLVEISVVNFPCNERARVADVKSADGMSDEDFLAKLTELGVEEDDAKVLLSKRNKSDSDDTETDSEEPEAETEEVESDDSEEVEADATDEVEAKYIQTAIEAVSNLIRELKRENHGR